MKERKSFTEFLAKLTRGVVENPGNSIAIAITAFFILIFSIFSIIQYLSLADSGYDLGMHAQVIESILHGKLFYSPLIGESLLAEHFTIFEFFQVPVYALYQSSISLLIFEDIFVALGGYVLYLISKRLLKQHTKSLLSLEVISIAFLLLYEMSPYTQSLVSFPFHSMAFLPFFFLLAIYAFLVERRLLHFFSLGMIVSLHSNFVYIVAILLLYELLYLRTRNGKSLNVWLSSKYNPRGKMQFAYFLIFIFALYAYVVFAGMMKGYISGIGFTSLLPGTGAVGSASGSPVGLLIMLFTDPQKLLSFISTNASQKLFYISFIFRNTAFIPLFSPLSLIMTVPYLLYALPSSYSSYYELGYQYGSMLTGPIFYGTIAGLSNIILIINYLAKKIHLFQKQKNSLPVKSLKSYFNKKTKTSIDKFIIVIGTVLILISVAVIPYGLFSPSAIARSPDGSSMQSINSFSYGNASAFLHKESLSIPSDAYILTENTLMPYFSNHINTYSTPWSPGIYNNLSRFTYVIFQYNSFWATTTQSTPSLQTIAMNGLTNGTYHIVASLPSSEVFVLERT